MPKYAVLSDIHANADAFETVLKKCRDIGVEKFICLGDLVGYNAEPARCIAMAKELDWVAVVRGNHDDYAVSGNLESSGFNPNARAAIDWTRHQLSKEDLDYLRALPFQTRIRECETTIVHATLDTPENWGYIFDSLHAAGNFAYQYTPVCFCGHSHVPVAFDKKPIAMRNERNIDLLPGWNSNEAEPQLDQDFSAADELKIELKIGHKYLFNIGSIGQPRNSDPRASFAVLDNIARTVTRYRLPYDVEAAQSKVRSAGLPERLAARLATGR